jgi:hypothetical protein
MERVDSGNRAFGNTNLQRALLAVRCAKNPMWHFHLRGHPNYLAERLLVPSRIRVTSRHDGTVLSHLFIAPSLFLFLVLPFFSVSRRRNSAPWALFLCAVFELVLANLGLGPPLTFRLGNFANN